MNTIPYTMVLVTFQCEKMGMSVPAYLYANAGVLVFSALCYYGAITYESHFENQFEEAILKFLEESVVDEDEESEEEIPDSYIEVPEENPEPKGPGEKLFTKSFIILVILAAIGGLQITYINTMPFTMFGSNFTDDEIVLAAQAKAITMIVGSFPVGMLVDKIGHRTLVNSLTNLMQMAWWLPFLL